MCCRAAKMKNTTAILAIREIAETLRCSKAHVTNVISGNMRGVCEVGAY